MSKKGFQIFWKITFENPKSVKITSVWEKPEKPDTFYFEI